MKTNSHQLPRTSPSLALLWGCLSLLLAGLSPVQAAAYLWDGSSNNWGSLHWIIPPDPTLVAGPTASGNTAAINGGLVIFPGHDTFGNAAVTASPALTLGSGAALASQNSFTTIWGLTMNGGSLLCNGGANANYPAFQLAGTLTIGGSQAAAINLGAGLYNGVSIGGSGNTTLTLNVAEVTGNAEADLIINAPLWNNQGLTQAGHLTKSGAGTLSLAATNLYTGNTYVNAGTLLIPAGGVLDRSGLVDPISGGTLTVIGKINLTNGVFAIGSSTAGTGTMNIEAGAVVTVANGVSTVSCTYLGGKINNTLTAGLGILNLNGGLLNLPAGGTGVNGDGTCFWLNPYANGGASTLNLNGGVLNTARPVADGGSSASIFNFNGGTFRSTYTAGSALQNNLTINVRNGGAIIDTTNANISISRPLLHSAIGGDNATDGGLTKNGAGSLTLSGGSTFNGNVVINSGTLQDSLAANNANPTSSGLGNLTTAGRSVTANAGASLVLNASDALGSYQYKTPVLLVANGGTIANGSSRFMALGDISLQNGGSLSTVNGAAAAFQAFNLRGTITVSGAGKSFLATSGTANHGLHLGGTTIAATTFNVGATGDPVTDLAVSVPLLDEVYNVGSLRKMGAGRMTLSAAARYTGPTLIGEGALIVATGGQLAAGSSVTVSNGATLAVTGSGSLNSAVLALNEGGLLDVSGASPAFALGGGQTLKAGRTAAPATDVTGSFSLSGGTLNVGGTTAAATLSLANDLTLAGGTLGLDLSTNPVSGNDTVTSAGTVTLASLTTIAINPLGGVLGNGTYTLVAGAAVVGGTTNVTLTGVGGGNSRQSFVLTNTGTALQLVVSGTAASLLWTAQADAQWDFSSLNWTNRSSLLPDVFFDADLVTFDDSALAGGVSLAGALRPGLATFNHTSLNYVVGGAGSLSGLSLIKSGGGALRFTNEGGLAFVSGLTLNAGSLALNNGGANSFGTVTINGGTLAFASDGLGSAGVIAFGGSGTLQWLDGNGQDISARLGALGAGLTATLDVGTNTVTATNAITGAGNWIKAGTGALILAANNSTGSGNLTVQQGVVAAAASTSATVGGVSTTGPLGNGNLATRTIGVAAGATLVFSAHDVFGNGTASPKLTLNIAGTVTNSVVPGFAGAFNTLGPVVLNGGTLSGIGGANANFQMYSLLGSVTVTGASPAFIIAGTNSFSGIHLGSAANSETTFDVANVTGDADYDLYVSAPLINRNTQQGGGAGGLYKTGAGTLVLWAANSYTGPTTISQGTLTVFPGGAIASTTINLVSGAVLDATALTGGFPLGAGQTLTGGRASSPAADVEGSLLSSGTLNVAGTGTNGMLTINGGLALAGGTLNLDLGPGGGDVIAINGPLNLSGTTVVQPAFAGGTPVPGTYTLITGISSIDSGSLANLALPAAIVSAFRIAVFDATNVPGSILLTLGGQNAALLWSGSNGSNWDPATTVNWDNAGLADKFFNGDAVRFTDASANGSVTLVGALQPLTLTISNSGTAYTFSGSGAIGGATGLGKDGSGAATMLANSNSFTGDLTLNGGTFEARGASLGANPAATALGAAGNGRNIVVNPGATLLFAEHDQLGNVGTTNQRKLTVNQGTVISRNKLTTLNEIILNGGTLTADGGVAFTYPNIGTYQLNGTVTATGNVASVMSDTAAANSRYLLNRFGGQNVFDVADVTADGRADLTIATLVADGWAGLAAGITKLGAGTLVLSASNIYTGTTTISNGMVRVDGSVASNVVVGGGRLAGSGTIGGMVAVQADGTLAVGPATGPLTLNVTPLLGGTVLVEVNRTNAPSAPKLMVNAPLAFGGILTVANTGEPLAGGEEFDLFDAASFSGSFAATNLPPLGAGLNWWLGSLASDGRILVNNAPTAGSHSLGAATGVPAALAAGKLLRGDADANGDTLYLTTVSGTSTNGGTVALAGDVVTYTSAPGFTGVDAFTYTLDDGKGGTATATVVVTVAAQGEGFNRVAAGVLENGDHRLTYRGIPNYPYALETAPSLTPPVVWTPVVTNPASALGELSFTNTPATNPIFYRTRHAP